MSLINLICCTGRTCCDTPAQPQQQHPLQTSSSRSSPQNNVDICITPDLLSEHSERLSKDISRSCSILRLNMISRNETIDVCFDDFKKDVSNMIRSFCADIMDEIKQAICKEHENKIKFDRLNKKITELEMQKHDVEKQFTMVITGNASSDFDTNMMRGSMDSCKLAPSVRNSFQRAERKLPNFNVVE